MKKSLRPFLLATMVLSFATGSASAVVVTASNDANALADALSGTGVSISNAVLSAASTTGAGTFSSGGAIGFNSGVLLTTGRVDCAVGPNNSSSCSGTGTTTSLKFDFTSTTGDVFFNYVFASEEYNEFVGAFNDRFELKLNGQNIAMLPNGNGVVSINNINNGVNSSFFRDNTGGLIDTQYDGLTTVLRAEATGLFGLNTFEFIIQDGNDGSVDSGVFLQAGTFAAEPTDVPEPGSFALLGLGLLGLVKTRATKRKSRNQAIQG